MSAPHYRPTAAELLSAVREFLETDVRGAAPELDFQVRVAANVLAIVEREVLDAGSPDGGPDLLGHADEAALAAAIRRGDLDGRDAEVLPVLRALVARRLNVAHPGYERE